MRNNIIDLALFLFLAVIWSSSFLLIKISVETIPPYTLTAARLCVAAVVLWIYLAATRVKLPLNTETLIIYLVVALLGHSFPYTLIGWGETRISSSLAAILMGIMPVVVVFLAHWLIPEEPLNRTKAMGVTISFAGLLLLVGFAALSRLQQDILGQLSVLGGAICYALCTIYLRRHKPTGIRTLATGTMTVGALISLILAFVFESPLHIQPTASSLGATLTLGLFQTALATLMFFRLIRRLGASTFSQINYLIPILGGLWGVWLLGESFSWKLFGSLALVLIGIYLVQKSNPELRKEV
ncbi:MAG: DMT family transporter [Gammaproteobacteria bacterium]|nr:DMT family transporter [Gammaproteobacteria bacterium]MCY4312533.1 DMT family transporter [Gammaproteobacteria bacterium]